MPPSENASAVVDLTADNIGNGKSSLLCGLMVIQWRDYSNGVKQQMLHPDPDKNEVGLINLCGVGGVPGA